MKKLLLIFAMAFLMLSAIISCKKTTGCHDASASNYEPNTDNSCSSCCIIPKPKGSLLIWTNMDDMFGWGFGAFYLNIDNGGLKLLNKYYVTPPANCVNQIGGYYYLDEGDHLCQIYGYDGTTLLQQGTLTVRGNQCNMMQLHPVGAAGVSWLK